MLLSHRILWIFTSIILMALASCSIQPVKATPEEIQLLQDAMQNVSDEFSNPRLVTGELTVQVSDIVMLEGPALSEANLAKKVPPHQEPSLYIWSSDIVDHGTQKLLSGSTIHPNPDISKSDPEYGNHILHWNPSLVGVDEILITRNFSYITFDYRPEIDRHAERDHWSQIPPEIW